jgi:RimJ/RimL family protein N-acetyltransferase
MLSGKIVDEFEIDGEKFVFRYPRFEDYPETLVFFNSLIKEGAMMGENKKNDCKREIEHILDSLKKIENKEKIYLLIEHDGKIIGEATVDKKTKTKAHVGELGISLSPKIRGKGIGTKLMEAVIREAKKNLKIEIVELEGFSQNKAALWLYKKMGFQVVGTVKKGLKRDGKYFDRLMMVNYLK